MGARAKTPGEVIVGEDVEFVLRPGSGDGIMLHERLLCDAIPAILFCSFVRIP